MKALHTIKRAVDDAGLGIVEVDYCGSNHLKIRLRRDDGVEANFVFSNTPSDRRTEANQRARLLRFARGDFNPVRER